MSEPIAWLKSVETSMVGASCISALPSSSCVSDKATEEAAERDVVKAPNDLVYTSRLKKVQILVNYKAL